MFALLLLPLTVSQVPTIQSKTLLEQVASINGNGRLRHVPLLWSQVYINGLKGRVMVVSQVYRGCGTAVHLRRQASGKTVCQATPQGRIHRQSGGAFRAVSQRSSRSGRRISIKANTPKILAETKQLRNYAIS